MLSRDKDQHLELLEVGRLAREHQDLPTWIFIPVMEVFLASIMKVLAQSSRSVYAPVSILVSLSNACLTSCFSAAFSFRPSIASLG